MNLWERRLSRRKLLALGGTALASACLTRGFAQALPQPQLMRLGLILPEAGGGATGYAVARQAASDAWTMAGDELGANAALVGQRLEVRTADAADAEAAVQAAEQYIAEEEVFAFAGGFGDEAALALSALAAERQVPFFNIGSPSDALRGASCNRYTFHVEASAAMYLDALTAWYVRAPFRNWFYVYADDASGQALYARAQRTLNERHFGAQEVGSFAVPGALADPAELLAQLQDSGADVVLLLVPAAQQLELLTAFEAAGVEAQVTGFPDAITQTRAYLEASREAAPTLGTGYRAALWEAKIDAYGARELNGRYLERWGRPMDGPAWAAYQTVKMLYEAAAFGGGTEADKIISYLENPDTNFDVYKGIGVSFRPWDHQLRQSLYLVDISTEAANELDLATLVGELPALYLPGTDPLERLDQLGDLEGVSPCSL